MLNLRDRFPALLPELLWRDASQTMSIADIQTLRDRVTGRLETTLWPAERSLTQAAVVELDALLVARLAMELSNGQEV